MDVESSLRWLAASMVQAWVGHFVNDESRVKNYTKVQITYQTPSPWWWSHWPLHRREFDEPMPPEPEGWAALRMLITMPPSKQFNSLTAMVSYMRPLFF